MVSFESAGAPKSLDGRDLVVQSGRMAKKKSKTVRHRKRAPKKDSAQMALAIVERAIGGRLARHKNS